MIKTQRRITVVAENKNLKVNFGFSNFIFKRRKKEELEYAAKYIIPCMSVSGLRVKKGLKYSILKCCNNPRKLNANKKREIGIKISVIFPIVGKPFLQIR